MFCRHRPLGILVCLLTLPFLLATRVLSVTYTWSGGSAVDGNWSTAGNWDTTPVSAADTDLVFSSNTNNNISTNDVANPFNLRTMTFNAGLPALTVDGSTLRFNTGRTITQNSANPVMINNAVSQSATNITMVFAGTGSGNLEIAGTYFFPTQSVARWNTGANYNLILKQVDLSTRSSQFINNNTVSGKEWQFNGDIRFIAVSDPTYFEATGPGTTVINGQFVYVGDAGGSFRFTPHVGGKVVLNNPAGVFSAPISGMFGDQGSGVGTIDLGGYVHDNVQNLTYSRVTATNGTLRLRGDFFLDNGTVDISLQDSPGFSANLVKGDGNNQDAWIHRAFDHTGVTRMIASDITLRQNGSINQSRIEFDVVPNGNEDSRLILDNSAVNHTNRLSDTKPIDMRGGQIVLGGNASAPTPEDVGPVTVSRQAGLNIRPAAGGVASLTGDSLTRQNGGTLYISGIGLGAAAGPNVSQVKFDTGPAMTAGTHGTTAAPVVPWVSGFPTDNTYRSYADVLTYDGSTGFRRLATGEFVLNDPANGAGANNRITSSQNLAGADVAIKSLAMVPTAAGTYTLGGLGGEILTVTDGVIVSGRDTTATPTNVISVTNLTFGPNAVTGYEGIIHSYSAMTIDSNIVDNVGNAVSLTKAGPNGLTLRGANVIGGTLRINQGTVTIDGNSSTTVGDIVIDAPLTGTLTINAGSTVSTTGTGTVLYVRRPLDFTAISGGGTLNLSGDVEVDHSHPGNSSQTTFSANLNLGAADRTFTVGNGPSNPDLIVSGSVSGTGGLTKAGAGQMRLSGANSYSGPTVVEAGQLQLHGANGTIASSPSLTFGAGARLTMDNSGSGNNNNDRISDSAPISLGGGSTVVKMIGNASVPTTEAVGALSFTGQNMISIDALAGGVARLSAPSLTRVGKGILVFSGDSPGAAAGANVSQIRLATPPALVGSGTGIYTPIYPFGIGSGRVDDWGSRWTGPDGGGFLTYDAGTDSLRLLSRTTEYATAWTSADNANVFFQGNVNLTADRTIQSFMHNDNTGTANINGSAGVQLTISSGLSFGRVENNQRLTYNVPFLTFGNPTTGYEGIVYNQGIRNDLGGGTVINSVIRDNGTNPVSLTIAGHGHTILGGANIYSGPTTVIGGKLVLDVGDDRLPVGTTLDIHLGGQFDLNNRSQQIAGLGGAGTVGSGGTAADSTLTIDIASGSSTFAGAIRDVVSSGTRTVALVKSGAGTQVLSGTNTYTGGTTVNAGTLLTTQAAALAGYDTSGRVVFNGGTLGVQVGGAGWTTAQVDTLLANATKTSGALGIDTTNGDLAQWTAFTTDGASFGANLGLTKLGANTLTLDYDNSYAGLTTIAQGTLRVGSGGTTGTLGTGDVVNQAALVFNRGNAMTVGSAISGSGSLEQAGAGILTLGGTNSYTGATLVSSGTLLVNGTHTGGGLYTVASGATLGGTGTIGAPVTIEAGGRLVGTATVTGPAAIHGTHAPGASPGLETFEAGLAYETGSTLEWELFANTNDPLLRGISYDGVDVTGGDLAIASGAILAVLFDSAGSTVAWGDAFWDEDRTWTVIDFSSDGNSVGLFGTLTLSGDADGALLADLRPYASFWIANDGGNIVFNYKAIPEPTSLTLLGLAALAHLRRRRR